MPADNMNTGLVHQYPARAAARDPHRLALVCADRRVTYRELELRMERVAASLRAAKLMAGSRIAWLGHNSVEYVELMLGAAAAGMVLVPINWRLAAPEIRSLVEDADPALLFHASEFSNLLKKACGPGNSLPMISVDGGDEYERWLASTAVNAAADGQQHGDCLPARRDPEDCFLQLYTSGTTGRPKGVRLNHRAFFARRQQEAALGSYYEWSDCETILVAAPVFHIAGSGWLLQGLHNGATCVIHPALDPLAMLDAVRTHRIRRVFAPPIVLRWMIDRQRQHPVDLSCLRLFLYGSAPIAPATLREALEVIPHCGFMHHYGMTEMTGSQVCMAPHEHDPRNPARLSSCGRPMPGVELRIVDPDGTCLATGIVGEIELRSAARMLGYWKQPEQTAQVVQDGWYKTGDAGRVDADGFLYIVDRIKDMIVTGGENVYPVEVENALHEHPAIALAAVIGRPHPVWGEAVHAVVTLRAGAGVSPEELIAFLRPRIAGFKIPRSYDFVASLPLTSSGKISKVELRRPYWSAEVRGVN